jgi:hypothetical protein
MDYAKEVMCGLTERRIKSQEVGYEASHHSSTDRTGNSRVFNL